MSSQFFNLAAQYLDSIGIKYSANQEKTALKVVFNGDNLSTIEVFINFDSDASLVSLDVWELVSFKGNEAAGYALCNSLNSQWRWGRFHIDEDGDLNFRADAFFTAESCGTIIEYMIGKCVYISDTAYPEIARARFAQ